MRISATGTPAEPLPRRRGGAGRAPGFTLIELLVVLVLVAILAGFAVLAVRGRDVQAIVDEDAERLFTLLTLVQEEALFRYRTIGIRLSQRGYRFLTYLDGEWQPSIDPLLSDRSLSDGVGFRLYLEGRPAVLELDEEQGGTEPEGDVPVPQLVFFPDGAITPFEIVIESDRAAVRTLNGSPTGQLTFARDDAQD